MRLLVTGGSGFVGGALCKRAEELGWELTSLSRSPARHGRWIQADLTQPLPATTPIPDVVIHAAARSSPWGSARQFQLQNVNATRNLVSFCESAGLPHLIYISTSAVLYRNEHQYDMSESANPPERFINAYAKTKFIGEEIVRAYKGPQTIIRPRAVFGPEDSVVFPRILRAARKGAFPIIESGHTVMADLIYIDTLVEYLMRVATMRAQGLYHLTNNHPVPVVSFLQDIFARLNLPAPKRRISVSRAMAAARLVESIYRALPMLGEPPITRFGVSVFAYSKTMNVSRSLRDLGAPLVSIDEGVARFLNWQRTQSPT